MLVFVGDVFCRLRLEGMISLLKRCMGVLGWRSLLMNLRGLQGNTLGRR